MVEEILLVPLFEQFIKESKNGKRLKLNGERISVRTIDNYAYALQLVKEFELYTCKTVRIKINISNNQRLLLKEKNYWKSFYIHFSKFLYHQKGYFDNFVGSIFKNLKCLFRYLKYEKCLPVTDGYKCFYVRKENIRVISLLPEQFSFLIKDKGFEEKLTNAQKRLKDLFVFGCVSALRYTDLMNLCVKDVECICGNYFLVFRSVKTDAPVQVKLPGFAIQIFTRYAKKKNPRPKLFPYLSKTNFNKNLRHLGQKAGWTEPIGKFRNKNGKGIEIKGKNCHLYRFCDQLSSHVMRRTGITLLLMLGMPEYMVRKISGHSAHSKEFFRYVNFAQSYVTDEIDKVHQKLLSLYQ